jgi:hypothetical protein
MSVSIHFSLLPVLTTTHWLSVLSLIGGCGLDDQKMVALCEGLQACPALVELDLGEEEDRDGGHRVLVQGLSSRIATVLISLQLFALFFIHA